jgi:hypothetical protein
MHGFALGWDRSRPTTAPPARAIAILTCAAECPNYRLRGSTRSRMSQLISGMSECPSGMSECPSESIRYTLLHIVDT